MAAEMSYLTYIADDGTHYTVQIDSGHGGYGPLGFAVYSAIIGALPRNMRMRYVSCRSATTGRNRRIPVGSLSCSVWTGGTTTLPLTDRNGASDTYTITGKIGQRETRIPHA